MELRRWPRKNDPDSIRARQEELAPRLDGEGEVFAHDLTPFAKATEAITGVALVPVAVVGPIDIELGDYELEEPHGHLAERGRGHDAVYVPLANTEGGLSISLYRGARAVGESGGFRTYVLRDRITRASAFLFEDVAQAVAFSAGSNPSSRRCGPGSSRSPSPTSRNTRSSGRSTRTWWAPCATSCTRSRPATPAG